MGGNEDLIRRLKLYTRLEGHSGCVNTVSFTPDGTALISGSDDRTVKIWDWAKGTPLLTYRSGHRNNVFQARAMPHSENKIIVTCAADGQVLCGTISEGLRLEGTRMLAKHEGRAHKLALESGNPNCFLSCGEDGVVYRFDLRDPSPATHLFTCHSLSLTSRPRDCGLNSIVLNPRRPHLLAVGGSDAYARVYDQRCCSSVRERQGLVDTFCPNHLIDSSEVHITCLAYSEQEEMLVSYNDELIYLFQKDMGLGTSPAKAGRKRVAKKGRGGGGNEGGGKASGERRGEENGGVAERDGEGGEGEGAEEGGGGGGPQVYEGHRNAKTVKGVSFFGSSSEYVVSGSDCGGVFLWKKMGGEMVKRLDGDSVVVNCLEPHPLATFLATSGIDSDIKIWTPTADCSMPISQETKQIMERNKRNRERISERLFTRIRSPQYMIMRTLQELGRAGADNNLEDVPFPYEGFESDNNDEESDEDEEDEEDEAEEEEGDVAIGGMESSSGDVEAGGASRGEDGGGEEVREVRTRAARRRRVVRRSECHVQ